MTLKSFLITTLTLKGKYECHKIREKLFFMTTQERTQGLSS